MKMGSVLYFTVLIKIHWNSWFYWAGRKIIRLWSSSSKVLRSKLILLWSVSYIYSKLMSIAANFECMNRDYSESVVNTILKVYLVVLEGKCLFEILEFVLFRHWEFLQLILNAWTGIIVSPWYRVETFFVEKDNDIIYISTYSMI